MKTQPDFSVALVYDKVNTPFGGAEHVLKAIHSVFPDAPLYTSVYDSNRAAWAKDFSIRTSWLQKLPFVRRHHQFIAPLMPLAFETLDLSEFDVIISITSSEAKGVLTKPEQLHICYLLTPTRYLYSHKEEYLNSHWFTRLPVLRQIARLLMSYLAWWDQSAASRPDYIIPISKLVQDRAKSAYQRNTEEVIYPPVPEIIAPKSHSKSLNIENFLLAVSRLVPYKRLDLAVDAALKTDNTLIISGAGMELGKLQKLAGSKGITRQQSESLADFSSRAKSTEAKILFTGRVTDAELHNLLSNCQAFMMPGLEDFGITALQANQMKKPVILHEKSGAAELLTNSEAIFLSEESLEEMLTALRKLKAFTSKAKRVNYPSFAALFRQKVYDLFRTHQLTVKKGQP